MRIGKENIEEVIFDFHEGNLSEEGKADLMDFLHKHPEYEKEFMLWAKTYHTDKPLLDYGNDDRFLKKKYSPPMKWGAWIVAAGVVATLIFWPKQKEGSLPQPIEAKQEVLPVAPQQQEKQVEKDDAQHQKRAEAVKKPSATQEAPIIPLEKDSLEALPSTPAPQAIAQPDTVALPQETVQLKEPSVEKKKQVKSDSSIIHKKPKRRRKLNLTPSDNILPFNSDF